MSVRSYSEIMGEQPGHLTLKLDTAEPIELGDFVGAFTSIANEFDRFVAEEYPGAKSDPRMYVREVRSGCIEADIVTGLAPYLAGMAGTAIVLNHTLVLEDFLKRWGGRLKALISNEVPPGELESDSQLADYLKAVKSIAADPLASHRLHLTEFFNGRKNIRATFKFTSMEARSAEQNIIDRRKMLAKPSSNIERRVLMRYTRTDVHDAKLNKKSGEKVQIPSISDRESPVMYASELAEQEIRQHIRDADENAYKRGFVVDVAVQMSGEKIIAYAVTALHAVIELD